MGYFDPYHKWLGIRPRDQPPNHYRLLGIDLFEDDPDVIDAAAEQRMTLLRQCATGPHIEHSQRLLNEVAAARLCLLKPADRAKYDASLKAKLATAESVVTLEEATTRQTAPASNSSVDASSPFDFEPVQTSAFETPVAKKRTARKPVSLPIPAIAAVSLLAVIGVGVVIYSMMGTPKPMKKPDNPPIAQPPRPPSPPKPDPLPPPDRKNSIGMQFVKIPAGSFEMGSPATASTPANEKPGHSVRITQRFLVGRYEVTQQEFENIMGRRSPSRDRELKSPVSNVTWEEANEFCRKLGDREKQWYRLPTEAEWEYACRAGSPSRWSFGDQAAELKKFAWYGANWGPKSPGERSANESGLIDMYGNVAEWCADWYDPDYYRTSPQEDPAGPAEGTKRVIRGGGWNQDESVCRSAARDGMPPGERRETVGFRVVLDPRSRPVLPPVPPPVIPPIPNPTPVEEPKIVDEPVPPKRAQAPNDETYAKKSREIRETFGTEFDGKTPQSKLALATKLLEKAKEGSTDPDTRYVLCKAAANLAKDAGNGELWLQAIDELAKTHDVDKLSLQLEVTKAVSKSALGKLAEQKKAVSKTLDLLDEFLDSTQPIDADAFETLKKMAILARDTLGQVKDQALSKRIESMDVELDTLRLILAEVEDSRKILATAPDDKDANLVVGKYECFRRGDWEHGLPRLRRGTEGALKSLAQSESRNPDRATEQKAIGDGWWLFADSQPERPKWVIRRHAATWYERSLAGLDGTAKDTAKNRIDDVAAASAATQTNSNPDQTADNQSPATKNAKSESLAVRKSISAGLQWIAKQQLPDGSWDLGSPMHDPGTKKSPTAATGLSLLAYLRSDGARNDKRLKQSLNAGLNYLAVAFENSDSAAASDEGVMYGHGICTLAICEAMLASKEHRQALEAVAQSTINYIVNAQHPQGGWRYKPQESGDTSVTGWQVAALKRAFEARLIVPELTLRNANLFLDSVQSAEGSRYCYLPSHGASDGCTAIGLVSRLELGWSPQQPAVMAGAKYLAGKDVRRLDIYKVYYTTRLLKRVGGELWTAWRTKLLDHVTRLQESRDVSEGSWNPGVGPGEGGNGTEKTGGRLYLTCMCVMTLSECDEPDGPSGKRKR